MAELVRKFNGKLYKRRVSGFAYKKDAVEKAEGYRHFGIPVRIVTATDKKYGKIHYVYVLKKYEKAIRKRMIMEMWI